MVQHKTKSRTFRRVQRRTVKGSKTVYTRRKPSAPKCAVTGQKLHGVPRGTPGKLKKLSKSQKRPSRPFGGVLSSKAAREEIKKRARANN